MLFIYIWPVGHREIKLFIKTKHNGPRQTIQEAKKIKQMLWLCIKDKEIE